MAAARPSRQVADSLIDYLGAEIVAYYGSQQVVPPGAALDAIGERKGESIRSRSRPPALSPLSCALNLASLLSQASASATSWPNATPPAGPAWATPWTSSSMCARTCGATCLANR